jgi:RNA polymerase sigma-B factor
MSMSETSTRSRTRRQRDDRRLTARRRAGDPDAREDLVQRYLPLARSLAMRYRRSSESNEDLFQVACLGLVKAVDRWDPSRGLAFSSFAVPTILGELRRHFRDSTWAIRPGRDLQELCLAVEEARDTLWSERGHSPTVAEIAEYLGRRSEEILEALHASDSRSLRSLDAPSSDAEDDSSSVGELTGVDDPGFDHVETAVSLDKLLGILDERSQEILRLRFQEDMLQREIAERIGCSQMHVSRIIRAALERLYAAGTTPPA